MTVGALRYRRWNSGSRRRDFLGMVGAGVAGLLVRRAFPATAHAEVSKEHLPPRYWLMVVPSGGIDPVWTTDPKTHSDVKSGVDVPYAAKDIVQKGGLRLGPHFAPLQAVADRLTILNGVLIKAANHYTGIEQVVRLRTSTTMRSTAALDVIGAHRDSQAVAHAILNMPLRQGRTSLYVGSAMPGDFGGDKGLFEALESLDPEELEDLAGLVGKQAESLKRRGDLSHQQRRILDALSQTRDLFSRVTHVPKFAPEKWLSGPLAGKDMLAGLIPNLQRALWILENDLAAGVTVFADSQAWDTHIQNNSRQSQMNPVLAEALRRLFAELDGRTNRHGRLSNLTGVLVLSEMGRFPYLNFAEGKDHFPQVPAVFAGPTFPGGRQLAATGKELEALPVNLQTGASHASGERLLLDDIGSTILTTAGIAPASYGFSGRDLPFLRRS